MILLITIIAGVYLVRSMMFIVGARRAAHPARAQGFQPFVSVVVAVRNEEKNIRRCLESLVKQEYPSDKFEIIVMDDGSTDGSAREIAAIAARHSMIKVIPVQEEQTQLRGKVLVISQGFDYAAGEILVTTDADCTVASTWLSTIVSYFAPESNGHVAGAVETGIVAGFTLLEYTNTFSAVQALDWVNLMSLGSAGIGLAKPLGCIGNNLSLRKTAYESVGGYRGIPFSITEDLAILLSITANPQWKCKYPRDAAMSVRSAPCADAGSLWAQKRRWAHGGKKLKMTGYIILIINAAMNAGILYSLVTMEWAELCSLLAVRWIADACIVVPTLREFKSLELLQYFIPYEIYALLYESALPFSLLRKTITWKGRNY